jgi:hypothetical protein
VRINHIGSGRELDDLRRVLSSTRLDALLIPKVDVPEQVFFVSRLIDLLADRETYVRVGATSVRHVSGTRWTLVVDARYSYDRCGLSDDEVARDECVCWWRSRVRER